MIFLLLLSLVTADVYMHAPRGSNDRNCERNVNRNNGNRLFDSQNNAKGGYACPRAVSGSNAATPPKGLTPNMRYEVGSKLEVEWTAQHGCGAKRGNAKEMSDPSVHCEMVIQMICAQTSDPTTKYGKMYGGTAQEYLAVPRQGIPNSDNDAATNRIATTDPGQAQGTTDANNNAVGGTNANIRFAVHETPQYYNECNRVERNRNLFTADQNVNRRSAIGTRQNPNGGRRGLECPEERDYYPYWRPSPFLDVAYLVDDPARCGAGANTNPSAAAMVTSGSFCGGNYPNAEGGQCGTDAQGNAVQTTGLGDWVGNAQGQSTGLTAARWMNLCVEVATDAVPTDRPQGNNAARRAYDRREWPNNEAECLALNPEGGTATYKWGANAFTAKAKDTALAAPLMARQMQGPQCGVMDWSRANHLGNNGEDTASRYTMTIPDVLPAGNGALATATGEPCALRLRYNMSSSDYVRDLNSSFNQKNGQESPIQQDPLIKVGPKDTDYVELALNTNQVARTFQDRSYIFYVQRRVTAPGKVLQNVNVRGKRGNIVQCYPSVEYNLIPDNIEFATENDATNTVLQFQWTGTDYNPRRGCNDGEGGPYVNGDANVAQALANNGNTQGSNQNSRMDRMTLLPVVDNRKNYPESYIAGANAPRLGAPGSASPWFTTAAQAEKFGTAGCTEQLGFNQASNGAGGVYPKLVARKYQPLTGEQIDNINNENQRENHPRNCGEGNAVSPYFSPENLVASNLAKKDESNCLYSPRNNNFSNRETRICVSVQGTKAVSGAPIPAQFTTLTRPIEYADEESTNYTNALEFDAPPFEPVENDDYGDGQKEGCTQEMLLFTGSAASYAPFYFLFLALIQLF